MIDDIALLLYILAWPVAFIVIALLLRRHLPALLQRASKVSIYGVEIELASAMDPTATWSMETGDVRKATAAPEFTSGLMHLLEQFQEQGEYDFALVDLGRGESWLTSRLYIFSLMLHRMCSLRCWVFVEPGRGIDRRFLGFAEPTQVRWTLAHHYPFLEEAFIKAQSEVGAPHIESPQGKIHSTRAADLVLHFLRAIQQPGEPPSDSWVPLPRSREKSDEKSEAKCEHAEWIKSASLRDLLGSVLQETSMAANEDRPKEERLESVLRLKGDFVALVGEGGSFKGLVDRSAVLEEVAARLV